MKKMLSILLMCVSLISTSTFAESRVNTVITSSVEDHLAEIKKLQSDIKNADVQLEALSVELEAAVKKHKGHEIFLATRKFAGYTTLATLAIFGTVVITTRNVGTGILSLIGGGTLSALSGAVVVGSQIGVMLTNDEADQLRSDIKELKKFSKNTKEQILKEIQALCKMNYEYATCK